VAIDANTVRVKFTRNIKPSTFMSDGSQFTINNGLTVSSATLSGRFVDLVTSAQTPGTQYTVTAANSLHDLLDVPLDAAHLTAMFGGFVVPAKLVINEVNPNISGSHDLIELRVVQAGGTGGIVIQQDFVSKTLLATLPAAIVAVDDIIVVHLNPAAGITSETMTKTDCPMANGCYDGAWDFVDATKATPGTTGITFSDRLLVVVAPDGSYQDAVAFTTSGASPSGFPTELQALQAAGLWMPADCGGGDGTLCTYTTTPSAETISVQWKTGIDATTGTSVSRKNPTPPGTLVQTHSNADWYAPGASSFGAANPN
jgi:hypothetical protein